MRRWGEHRAIWNYHLTKRMFDPLQRDVDVDVAVVGAGITGLTAALMLTKAGKKVALVTDGEIGAGTTGYSTGHLTEILDEDFGTLVSDFGKEKIRRVISSVREAIN